MELQGLVGDMKQHQDRLLDTAAHLSNELSVNQEHLKVRTYPLYTVHLYVCTHIILFVHSYFPTCSCTVACTYVSWFSGFPHIFTLLHCYNSWL